jgi:hypothetical protein
MRAPGVEGSSEFVFPPPGCGEYEEKSPCLPEYEELHIPSQRWAVPVMILSVHPEGGSFAVRAVYIEISGGRVKKPVILAAE